MWREVGGRGEERMGQYGGGSVLPQYTFYVYLNSTFQHPREKSPLYLSRRCLNWLNQLEFVTESFSHLSPNSENSSFLNYFTLYNFGMFIHEFPYEECLHLCVSKSYQSFQTSSSVTSSKKKPHLFLSVSTYFYFC